MSALIIDATLPSKTELGGAFANPEFVLIGAFWFFVGHVTDKIFKILIP